MQFHIEGNCGDLKTLGSNLKKVGVHSSPMRGFIFPSCTYPKKTRTPLGQGSGSMNVFLVHIYKRTK